MLNLMWTYFVLTTFAKVIIIISVLRWGKWRNTGVQEFHQDYTTNKRSTWAVWLQNLHLTIAYRQYEETETDGLVFQVFQGHTHTGRISALSYMTPEYES